MESNSQADKKAIVRLNEIMVITTLARSGNDPMYISKIKANWPIVHNLNDDQLMGFTKQGIQAACERLVGYDILAVKDKPAPKRPKGTPHYWIKKDLFTLFRIEERYGTFALDEVRNSLARILVNDKKVNRYLAKQLNIGEDDIGKVDVEHIRSITTMAKSSTTALRTFLRCTRPMASNPEESRSFDLASTIEKLKVMMTLEFLLGLMGDVAMLKQGWKYDVDIKADISRGDTSIELRTRLKSSMPRERL